jgi:hypothetical protein
VEKFMDCGEVISTVEDEGYVAVVEEGGGDEVAVWFEGDGCLDDVTGFWRGRHLKFMLWIMSGSGSGMKIGQLWSEGEDKDSTTSG